MTRAVAYSILLAFGVLAVSLMAARPDWISDQNLFLKNFVNHEFINVLGVTLAITLASAAQIHLALNRIEEKNKIRNALEKTRRELREATYWLISMFVVGVAVVVVKPVASGDVAGTQAFFNMLALFVLLFHVLLLVSLTQLVFSIEPEYTEPSDGEGDRDD